MSKKLYKVTLKGMTHGSPSYGISYAVADNLTQAYDAVKKYLDDNDLGFSKDRELHTIELLAEACGYPSCGTILHFGKKESEEK